MLAQQFLSAVAVLGLTLVTCSPDSNENASENVCTPISDGPSLLRFGACSTGAVDSAGNATTVILAQCKAEDGLLRPCDELFATWCNMQGVICLRRPLRIHQRSAWRL